MKINISSRFWSIPVHIILFHEEEKKCYFIGPGKKMENKRILIIENEKIRAEDVKCDLQNLGYDICATANSRCEAIQIAKEIRPDLILMDINLKDGMDGIEFANMFRSQLKVPIAFLTPIYDERKLKHDAEELEKANVVLKRALDGLLKRVEQKHKPKTFNDESFGSNYQGAVSLYSIDNETEAHSLFLTLHNAGLPTLAVIRKPPKRFHKVLGKEVETVWLTTNQSSDGVCLNPSNLTRLSMVLTEFLRRAPEGVILFEGTEYLLSIVGFQSLLNLIQLLNDKIAESQGAIFLILDLAVLNEKEKKYIQRECLEPERTL